MNPHLDTVQAIYQAFGRGDVPAILAALSPHVAWESWIDHSAQRAGHPLFAPRQGAQEVPGFFAAIAQNLAIHEFKVVEMFGSGRQVAAEIAIDCDYLSTGRHVRDEELHLWTFGEDGKVLRFRHYVDTAKHIAAAGLGWTEAGR